MQYLWISMLLYLVLFGAQLVKYSNHQPNQKWKLNLGGYTFYKNLTNTTSCHSGSEFHYVHYVLGYSCAYYRYWIARHVRISLLSREMGRVRSLTSRSTDFTVFYFWYSILETRCLGMYLSIWSLSSTTRQACNSFELQMGNCFFSVRLVLDKCTFIATG